MPMNRREFLKAASAAGCLLPLGGVSSLAWGAAAHAPLLVTVFLRGGADGLHLVGPSADPDYIAARPPELRVGENGLLLEQSLKPAAGFRLHSEAGGLAELYQAKRLSIIHAVGLTDATRSHFVAQDLMERGLADEKRITSTDGGWLTHALSNANGLVPGYSATATEAYALHGLSNLLAAPDISAGLGLPWGAPTRNLLQALSMTGSGLPHRAGVAALNVLDTIDRQLPHDGAGKTLPYKPAGKLAYEGKGDLARSLASVARLARMDVGLAAACVDHGGWDTHEGQAGRFANQVQQLSQGLSAFYDDMQAAGRRVVVLVMTEFGRRVRSNKSNGTDHGHGGAWLVLGDGVQGGRMAGKWPGLSSREMDQGLDLAVTTDYRQVLAETLAATQLPANTVFPDWKAKSVSLGLF